MTTINLTLTPSSYQFTAKEEKELRELLLENDRSTVVTPVMSPKSDLYISTETGKTVTNYVYSDTAYVHLCGLISPGLAQFTQELSGQWRKPGEDKRRYSSELAIQAFNQAVKLRFDQELAGLQLVRNTRTKVIDGIVGTRYRYLANSDFLDKTTESLYRLDTKFHQAYLYGRQLVLRYVHPVAAYEIAGEPYDSGFHFANSEIGGKSVRAACIVTQRSSGLCALGPFAGQDGGRVVHSGRDFEKRLHALLEAIIKRIPSKTEVERGGALLLSKSLGFGGEGHNRRCRQISGALTRKKVTLTFAKRVVSSAAAIGSDDSSLIADEFSSDQELVLSHRTGYDLFISLIREAKHLPIDQRETVEQVGYALLTGKLWV